MATISLEIDFNDIDYVSELYDGRGYLEEYNIIDLRRECLIHEISPMWMFVAPGAVGALMEIYPDHFFTKESVLMQPFVVDYEQVVDLYEQWAHPDSVGLFMGMSVFESVELKDAIVVMGGSDAPDTSQAVKLNY